MRIDVALVPSEAKRWTNTVCIVLDELRASSTIVTALEGGATAVVPASSLADARRLAREIGPSAVLAGEHKVVRAPGFAYGNSPAEVAAGDVAGRTMVLSTRNGTAVLRSLPAGTPVLIGCLLNATAVARAALALARETGADVGIVCAGRRGTFAVDDAIAAGAILERLFAAAGVDDRDLPTADGRVSPRATREPAEAIVVTDATLGALRLWRATPDLEEAFRASFSGHLLASVGLLEDIPASVRIDVSSIVPTLVEGSPARIEPR